MNKITLTVLLCVYTILSAHTSFAQTTFTSVAGGSFETTGAAVWSPSPIASDFTDGLNTFIIADGHTITIDGAATITVSSIEVGQGASGILTIGDGVTPSVNSLTINNSLVIQTSATFQVNNNDANTHTLRVDGDIINNGGTFDLENGTGLVNTTLGNTSTSVLSGSTMIFNDLTINGGGAILLISTIDVNGDFVADLAGTDISTAVNHNFAGDFTLSNSATYTATSSVQIFDGAGAQALSFTGGTAAFNSITFDNSTKTVTGDLITNGTFEITDDAVWSQTGGSHRIQNFEVKNASGVLLNTATITFTGGEIRFGDDTNTDGTITLGTAVDLIIEGTEFIERDDILIIDGNMEILSIGQFVINGTNSAPPVDESDSELQVTGARTLTIRDGGDIYIRGYDNFPTGFTTYNLEPSSLVRYDRDYDQLVMGENSANVTIDYGRLYMSQPDASAQRTRQLFTGDAALSVVGQFDLVNGLRFYVSHVATLTFNEDLYMDSGTTAGDPIFDASNSIVILDSDNNQVVDGPVSGNYQVEEFQITNTATPTAAKIVFIRGNVTVGTAFTVQNPNGSAANLLIVDIDANLVYGGLGSSETFTLGANCALYTSSADANGFAQGFSDGGDVVNIDASSIVRFDLAGNQSIPNFNGGNFGTIQFSGSGNKYVNSTSPNLVIAGDVTRVGGTPIFRFGTISLGATVNVSHTVQGDWNMATAYTGDTESNPGSTTALITFNGADQNISASDFDDITFGGTGTKTLTGALLIDGDVIVNDGVTVDGGAEAITVSGNWTEAGTGTFTQTANTTNFNSGGTRAIVQTANSTFFRLNISNNSIVNFNSTVQAGQDLNIENGSTINIEGQTVRVKRHLNVNSTATISYASPTTTIINMNGDTEQNIRNYNAAQNFPTFSFTGVGNKEVIDNTLTIEGNLTIANESTFNGNNRQINFHGTTWTNSGNFNHTTSVNFVNDGGTTTITTSTFHDIHVGLEDGSVTTTLLLDGNITLNGEMDIYQNGTLDVSANDYSITVEEDWNNYGIFNPRQGTVTFNGGRTDFRTFHATNNSGAQTDKAFYNLTVNISNEYLLVQRNADVLNDQLDVLNNLRVESGSVYLYENANAALLNIGGDFDMDGGAIIYSHDETKVVMNGSSGTHNINLGGDMLRDFEINASGATYQLTGDFLMRDDVDNEFTLTAGTFDLNGYIAAINRGGLIMTGGTLIVDEGASLLLNDLAADPDFNKSGGTLQITGISGSPATLSSVDAGGFTFTQSGGDFQAQNYTIANTTGDGIRIEGGSIDTGATGNDFSNGTFTSGAGVAYLTLANISIGTLSASNVIFNSGPTNNVAVDGANLPANDGGSIEFVISGGTLGGVQDELDDPDGGATTGFIRWNEDPGFTWTGATNTSWTNNGNWTIGGGVVDDGADGIPDPDDIVYLESGANNPIIVGGEDFTIARLTLRNNGVLTLQGTGILSIAGNVTVFTGSTIDMTDNPSAQLNVAGAWANAGTFNEGTATVTFNGTSGTNSITTLGSGDPFYNLIIAGDGATYTLGSIMAISNSFSLTDGTFDASSGFEILISNDWSVNGGILIPGQGRVRFNGTVGTQSISGGTLWDADFEGAAAKSIDGNISIADDVLINASSGLVSGNDKTIFVGGDWDLDVLNGFVPGTGTVIFNGTAAQNLEADDTHTLTFNNVIFQNGGQKNFLFTNTINGDMSIISGNTFVDLEIGSTLTVAGGITQTGGNLRIFESNFPTAGSYNFNGGDVDFLQDAALTIPADIIFNNLEIRALADVATTATLSGDITVNGNINFSYGSVTFDVAGNTISLGGILSLTDNETLNWAGGTLIHTGGNWYIDADFNTTTRTFENLTLGGTGLKRPNSDIAVNGNLIVQDGVLLQQLTRAITNDAGGDGDTFSMAQNTILDNRVVGDAFPTGFDNYTLDPSSRVDLLASGDQTIFTNGGTLQYGWVRILNTGITTLDGNLTATGDFDMNSNATLVDGGFDMTLGGSFIDLQDYTPTAATTITFNGSGDQLIVDYDGAVSNLDLVNVVFSGGGTKTLVPNAADEVSAITGNVTINPGVTVTTARGVDFKGTSWINNGTFNLTVTARPFVFSGGNATMDPGVNDIAAMTISNSAATTVTIQNNGLNLRAGDFIISADAAIDFGSLTHNLETANFTIAPTGSWILENGGVGATLVFDRNTTQYLPPLDNTLAYITGTPSIQTSGAGTKILTSDIIVDNVTIDAGTNLDVSNGNDYQIIVNGNWTNNGGNFYERDGTVVFNSDNTDAKTIHQNGRYFRELIFQGTQVRTYSLQSNAAVYGNAAGNGLTLASATLDLNGNTLTLGNNDPDDPDAELNIIGLNGTLEVDEGATLQFETSDDGFTGLGLANTEIGGNLDVQSGGRLSIVGTAISVAIITRSAGANRIDINIESGGFIDAEYYNIQYLTDEGLEVEDGATIDSNTSGYNFSNGTFSNLATDTGAGDANPIAGNRYLTIESDASLAIDNVTFNFNGTPNSANHHNVTRSNAVGNNPITFTTTSGPLGRNGSVYEEDGDPTAPIHTNGQLMWDLPSDTQWVGTVSTDWSDAGNWDNGVPSIASNDVTAAINIGSPFNPIIDNISVNISELLINDGILKVLNSATFDLDGDLTLGDGTGGAFIMDNTVTVAIQGSWSVSANGIFDHGDGTVTFDTESGSTVSISPGGQSFNNMTFTHGVAAGDFNVLSNSLDINGNLIISNSANLVPSTAGYNYYIAGDITATGGSFDTSVDGEIILDGAAQLITDMSFDELTIAGSGTKTTSGTVVVNDNFIVDSGTTFEGGGSVSFAGDVIINGTFNGIASQTYSFSGLNWIAVANSYTGLGTVDFTRIAGTQFIRQAVTGDNPVGFNNLTLSGTAQVFLGRLIGGSQFDGNIDLTGNLTVNNTINTLRCNDYLIDNTSGTGTFTLASAEIIYILGADNFPSNFATYALDDASFSRYWGTIDQTVRGGIEYGHLEFLNPTTKTLGGNVNIDGQLYMRNATLDVSANNYSINLAGRWYTNYGNDDGSFIARSGTVTFDGGSLQYIDIGETGTQSFNDIIVNKANDSRLELITSNMTINGNVNVFNGVFDINNLTASIAGNMNAIGTGTFNSGATGLYYLNAPSGTPTIGTNSSSIAGNIEIDASGRVYELVDNLTLLNNFTLTAGTLDINGQTMSIGNAEDVVNIFGTLNVSTAAKPGGTLALGNDVQLIVQPGGTISIVGTASQTAKVTSTGVTDYIFSVTGTGGNPGNIAAKYYIIEYMGVDGIYINDNTLIDATNNFSDGTFQNGFNGGKYLRIENTQNLSGADRIENIVFDDNPGGGATSIYKTIAVSGNIEVFNYTGGFSGESYDEDPNNLIAWLNPPTVTWTGTVSNDWFTTGNWDSGTIPLITQNVIIPQTLNEPIITDNVAVAVANNLTLELNAILKINTSDAADIDLQLDGDLTFDASSSLASLGTEDNIELAGSWLRLSNALFTSGTSTVTFNSLAGVETIDNSDSFYDLIINVGGSTVLARDLAVNHDFTISGGTFDLSTSDLTVGGVFSNTATFTPQSQTLYLISSDAVTPKVFNLGASSLYSLVIGEVAGNDVIYDMSSDLTVNRNFDLVLGTVNPNTNDIILGNSDAIVDNINIAGTILMQANETMLLGDDAIVLVQSGGDVRFNGTDASNTATLAIRTTGGYDFTVQSGATFEATFFHIGGMANDGIWIQSGATLAGLADGVFSGGSASQYMRLSNTFGGGDITATNITFNTGPTNNIRRNEGAGNNIIFSDAAGSFSGSSFELDDGVATTGEVQWSYTAPLRVWTGAISTQYNIDGNWEDQGGLATTFPTGANTVQIPDVSGASNRFPIVDNVSGNQAAGSLTIALGATFTVNDDRAFTVTNEISNSGTITITGTGSVSSGDSWTNDGTFNPGNSTVTLTSTVDVTLSGGIRFYNLNINGGVSTVVFSTSSALDVDNDLTINTGTLLITDVTHTTNIGGNFTVDATNGSFVDSLSTVTFDGTAQNIGSALHAATIIFNNLTLSGSGIKTLEDVLNINGDLSIESGVTMAMLSQSITFSGNSFSVDGTLDVSGGTSTITFDGDQIQVITGTTGAVSFDNLVINNTAAGSSDVQLNADVSINDNVNFDTGIIQSSASNPITFIDNATVSYDGTEETAAFVFPGADADGNSFVSGPVIKIGDDNFIFPIGEGSRIGRLGISSIVGATPTDQYSSEYFFGAHANKDDTRNDPLKRVSGLEYWDLSNLNAHAGQPLVTLFWDATSEVNNLTSLTVAHYNGATWDDEGNAATTGAITAGTITSGNNFTSFSPITLGTTNDAQNALPVELLEFKGKSVNNAIQLDWSTASELNNDYFSLEHSLDGKTFEEIAVVTGNGTSEERNNYQYLHNGSAPGINYYRLRQVDFDGAEEVFDVILVNNTTVKTGLDMVIYPNPSTNGEINIRIQTGDGHTPVLVKLMDMAGSIYYNSTIEASLNIDEQILPNRRMSAGIYIITIQQGSNITHSKLTVK